MKILLPRGLEVDLDQIPNDLNDLSGIFDHSHVRCHYYFEQ